jgi:ATP-dependent protease ClpP protease subunit
MLRETDILQEYQKIVLRQLSKKTGMTWKEFKEKARDEWYVLGEEAVKKGWAKILNGVRIVPDCKEEKEE